MSKRLLKVVREKFPQAITAVLMRSCDNCKSGSSIFFQIEGDEYLGMGWFSGGVYCQHCGFSNSARVHVDALYGAEDYSTEEPKDLSFTAHDDATSAGCQMCGNEWKSLNSEGFCSSCYTVWKS